jgi:hypothetical protein
LQKAVRFGQDGGHSGVMYAALDINIPNYARAVVNTAEIVTLIGAVSAGAKHREVLLAS